MVKGCLLLSSDLFSLIRYIFYCLLAFFLVRTDQKSGTGLGLTSLMVLIVVSLFLRCSTKLVKLGQLDYL